MPSTIRNFPVIITATHDHSWNEGLGRLYEPFEDDEEKYIYSVLHIEASVNIPHGQVGFYPLTAMKVEIARQSGLILTDAQGDQSGFEHPDASPCESLDKAIQHLQKHLHLQSEETLHVVS